MPEPAILEAAVRAVEGFGPKPPARALDLSCGDGDLLERLADRGYAVEGTHYREDDYILRHRRPILERVPLHTGTDLTRPLDFGDETFDLVLATEVLEHLPSHVSLIREIGRILKPGGLFVFTTPNIHRLQSRSRFFLTGFHALCGARTGWHVPPDELYSTHFNPVYFPVMHTLLRHAGLRVREVGRTRIPAAGVPLLLLAPLLFPATWMECAHARKRSREGGADLLKWMTNPRMLLSKQLVVAARRE